jgi:membrane-associated phospholipid phosphatase
LDSLLSFLAEYFYLIVAVLALVFALTYYRKQILGLILAGGFILVVAYLLSKIATQLISDPRPFIQNGVPALIQSATDNGFPSDHTLLLAAIAATFSLVNWKAGLTFLGLALLVGLARVYVRVHHLVDILGSVVIVGIALLIYFAAKALIESLLPANEKYHVLLPLRPLK